MGKWDIKLEPQAGKSCTFAIEPAQNIKSIIRKEPFEVQCIWEQLSHRRAAHLLVVLMLVGLEVKEVTYETSKQWILLQSSIPKSYFYKIHYKLNKWNWQDVLSISLSQKLVQFRVKVINLYQKLHCNFWSNHWTFFKEKWRSIMNQIGLCIKN